MEGKSVTIGVRVPEGLRDALATMAKADNRTLSQFCMLILREHAERALGEKSEIDK